VPHQLCRFHFLHEAANLVYEADRHAKKELKEQVRGVRPIEGAMEGRDDAGSEESPSGQDRSYASCLHRRDLGQDQHGPTAWEQSSQ
jgi:hypothetical protein